MATDTVLYIEDHQPSVQLVERLMSIYPYNLLVATSAEDGFDMAQQELPKIILLDMDLPGMDGLTAIRLFKQHPLLKDIPIIVVTSHDDLREECREAGVNDFIQKPIPFDQFHATLRRML